MDFGSATVLAPGAKQGMDVRTDLNMLGARLRQAWESLCETERMLCNSADTCFGTEPENGIRATPGEQPLGTLVAEVERIEDVMRSLRRQANRF